MLKNYLKIALRHIYRHKFYFLVNVIGLGIALACCIIAYLNYQFDRSFDTMHEKAEDVYRLTMVKGSNQQEYAIGPLAMTAEDVPGVQSTLRLYRQSAVVKQGDEVYKEVIHYSDPEFFDLFSFELLRGREEALRQPNQLFITERMARKYFGEEDPLGRPLLLLTGETEAREFIVSGIVADPPLHSSLDFDFLCGIQNLYREEKPANLQDWELFTHATFIELENSATPAEVENRLEARYMVRINDARPDWQVDAFFLTPLTEMAHRAHNWRSNYFGESLPASAVWGPNVMAILLLLTAGLNFTNTTISTSNRRLTEMGIRKVLGGSRRLLIMQLLSETAIVCLFGLCAALVMVEFLLPQYNAMWPFLHLEADYFSNPSLLLFLVVALALTALVSGAYPALYISSFSPVRIFRSGVRHGGSDLFSRLMIGLQVAFSLTAVVGGLNFYFNARFQKNADLGYQHRSVIGLPIDGESDFERLRARLVQNPDIQSVAGSRDQIGFLYRDADVEWRGERREIRELEAGPGYLQTMRTELVSGRYLDGDRPADFTSSVMVTENMAATFGAENMLGSQITVDSNHYQVVGITENFFPTGFFSPMHPVIIRLAEPQAYRVAAVRTEPGELPQVYEQIKREWNSLFPFRPFEGYYQDEVLAGEMLVTNNIKSLFIFLALVSILLTATGLFALVSLNVLRRLKEIAVRKVVGASLVDLALLLNKNYFWIFLVSVTIGSAGGYFLTRLLLDSIFATHAGIDLPMVILASAGVLLIAVATIALKIRQLSKINPADILRTE